ncbi:putative ribonuclease H-like domain-containing protein [Tanacetum coccineum]
MNEFMCLRKESQNCAKKGIKREFSVARTPQQNGVAERKNRTLIEAARTMLADSLLPIPFWAEAVNTACYVLNRVLVTKPQNKTPYELLIGKSPSISFMRPFGCPLTILNTLDSLGKFDGKSDEGYLLGYSTSSKAFRVYNKRTKRVEENLHINFLEDQPNVTGTGTQDSYVAGSSGKDKGPTQEYILLPLQPHRKRIPIKDVAQAAYEQPSKSSSKDNDIQDSEDAANKESEQDLQDELEKMVTQELAAKAMDDVSRQAFKEEKRRIASQKKAAQATSTNQLSTDRPSVSTDRLSVSTDRPFVSTDRSNTPYVSVASTPTGANAGESSFVYLGGKIPIDASTLPNADLPIDPNMPNLEDASDTLPNDGIFNEAYDDDEDVGAVADFNLLVDQFLLGQWGTAVKTSAGYSWRHTRPQFWGSKSNGGSRQSTWVILIKGGIVKFGGGDGRISGKGTIRTSKLDFENVYYVEELQHFNLFSVSQICDKKNKVLFTDTDCLVLSEEFQLPDASQVVLRIPRKHDLYTFHISDLQPEQKVTCFVAKASLDGLNSQPAGTEDGSCEPSNQSTRKQHKASYKHISAVRLITDTLQLLHMDLFGPTNIRNKDETFYVLKEFITLIENQLNKKVKGIRELRGIIATSTQTHTNGVAERKNRTLIEAARTMLADSKLPTMFWTEAVSTACYVLNRVSITNPLINTFELIFWKGLPISHLKPFGCQVTILNTSDYLGKFEGKADDGYLVGYASHSKAYRVYNLPNKRVEETLNLRFLEDKPNVQGIGHEWYFDLDYLTDSLGYTRFKTDTPAEELSKLQRQEYEAKDAAARYGYLFSQATAEILCQAEAEIRNQGVSAVTDPAGIDSAVREPAGIVSADGVSTGSPSADSDPAGSNPADCFPPAGSVEPTDESNPAVSSSVLLILPVFAAELLHFLLGQQLGSCENYTRFPIPY